MLKHILAALLGLGQPPEPTRSAPPDVPVQPRRDGRTTGPNRQDLEPASAAGSVEAAATVDPAVAELPDAASEEWDPCPCGQWGVCRADRHGCVAMCKELFPQLDQDLDAWEAEHGWLYR